MFTTSSVSPYKVKLAQLLQLYVYKAICPVFSQMISQNENKKYTSDHQNMCLKREYYNMCVKHEIKIYFPKIYTFEAHFFIV